VDSPSPVARTGRTNHKYEYPLPRDGIWVSNHKRPQAIRRVARIHGHVHAIGRMLEEGRSYSEIVHQIAAVRSSLDSLTQVIVEDLVEDCVTRAEKKEPMGESLSELQLVIAELK
jgi:DNA-binding FrmR family transcriptional regulator